MSLKNLKEQPTCPDCKRPVLYTRDEKYLNCVCLNCEIMYYYFINQFQEHGNLACEFGGASDDYTSLIRRVNSWIEN